ncbi:hypothetical protein RD110_08920 [Rhodoferax koreense]|uniref:Uncharacterized protein n=1 Tax=Rhodoferax koreensis TaxID=1842727 RepID=A0A1P8JU55_9BURK|nr:hypothetical protein [Rhodoferax koreense]APW37299.1 hypothetical protein RD110_08920 [Rhodoferax koreense]
MPIDPTPEGQEILHQNKDASFPPEATVDAHLKPELDAEDISHRPPLPTDVPEMAADIEDEDDDPVVDTGPGIDK